MMRNKYVIDSHTQKLLIVFASCGILLSLFGGNILYALTGEYPTIGAGFTSRAIVKADVETYITTSTPERYLTGLAAVYPPLGLRYLTLTGLMTQLEDGTYKILITRHAAVLTTIGKNYIEDQLGDSAGAEADYIALSNDATEPTAAYTQLVDEIAANGLTRAQGTYASTGDGTWTITKEFTASGAQSCRTTSLNWSASGDNNMLFGDDFSSVTLANADKITIVFSLSVS